MTWTIRKNEKEIARKTELDRVLEERVTQKEAALRLNLSERQVRRLIHNYRQEGVSGIVSKRRGTPSNRRLDESKRGEVVTFIKDDHTQGFGPIFMAEKLEEIKEIKLSKESVRKYMIEAGVWKARTRKKAVPHYVSERRRQRGELVQIDGSYHAWLEERGLKTCLLVFVDDASSEILAAEFVPQENYFTYGNLCKRYFKETGVPLCFYSRESVVDEPVTQFQRAISGLDIEQICTNSPQAKGRVERANQTLQNRLIKEMHLLGISDYEEANLYPPVFIQDYNARFALRLFQM